MICTEFGIYLNYCIFKVHMCSFSHPSSTSGFSSSLFTLSHISNHSSLCIIFHFPEMICTEFGIFPNYCIFKIHMCSKEVDEIVDTEPVDTCNFNKGRK
jgi:hypothetical protein